MLVNEERKLDGRAAFASNNAATDRWPTADSVSQSLNSSHLISAAKSTGCESNVKSGKYLPGETIRRCGGSGGISTWEGVDCATRDWGHGSEQGDREKHNGVHRAKHVVTLSSPLSDVPGSRL